MNPFEVHLALTAKVTLWKTVLIIIKSVQNFKLISYKTAAYFLRFALPTGKLFIF